MILWITTIGWSPYAVINPIWAYCKENNEIPDRIIFLNTSGPKIKENLDFIKKNLNIIFRELVLKLDLIDKNQEIKGIDKKIKNEDIQIYSKSLITLMHSELKRLHQNINDVSPENNDELKIIFDMTPGRKFMSAFMMYFGIFLLNLTKNLAFDEQNNSDELDGEFNNDTKDSKSITDTNQINQRREFKKLIQSLLKHYKLDIKVLYLHLFNQKYQNEPLASTPIFEYKLIEVLKNSDSSMIFFE